MDKKYRFFAFLSRLRYLNRWPLIRNTSKENVLEHTAQVAMLANGLAIIRNKYFGGNVNAELVTTLAIYHDVSEVITSDLPTPIKYYNAEITKAFKHIEAEANKQIIEMLPEDLQNDFAKYFENSGLYEQEWKVVKAADKLAAYLKCVEEMESGNGEFSTAKGNCMTSLNSMNMPEIQYFLDNFASGFGIPLHDL